MSEARFRKRPVEVDAICWNGQNLGSVQAFASGALGIGTVEGGALPLWVVKSEAVCNVQPGDWIIRETDGSGYYPCAGDVFAATYEPAGPPDGTAEWPADALHARGEGIMLGESWVLTHGSLSYREAGERILSALDVPRPEWPRQPSRTAEDAQGVTGSAGGESPAPGSPGPVAAITAALEGNWRDILEALCRRNGLSLESAVEPGEPARNYELALRLGIGRAFGIQETPGD